MSFSFEANFKFHDENNRPYNWRVEKNSSMPHTNAALKDGAYAVLLTGNKHLADIPPLQNFELEFKAKMILAPRVEKSGFVLFFRYDRSFRTGYALSSSFHAGSVSVKLGIVRDQVIETIAAKEIAAKSHASECDVRLSVAGNVFTLSLNGAAVEFTDENHVIASRGQVGFDKTDYFGEFLVEKLTLSSGDPLEKNSIVAPIACELPCVNGMSVPYQYKFNLAKYNSGPYELEVEISGGIKNRPDRPRRGGWCYEIDRIRNPYLRIESPRGEFKNIILFEGLMTLFDRDEKRPFPIVHVPVEWPLKRTVYFQYLPDPSKLFFAIGYDDFENDPIRYAGGPLEVILDNQGHPLYQGASLRRGKVALSVTSPEDKQICARIPKNLPDYEKALAHARNNHYFMENERPRFKIRACCHASDFCEREFSLKARLETVFGEPLATDIRLAPAIPVPSADDRLAHGLGIRSLWFEVELRDRLASGVYHLALSLRHSEKMLVEETVAFDIISEAEDALPPPMAAGLPLLYSAPNEIVNFETDAFDPWSERAGTNNAEHYFSMSCFYPDVARKKRAWELLSLYQRKWFLWLTGRTCGLDSRKIEDNRDIIAHCDYLNTPYFSTATEDLCCFDLWNRSYYKFAYLELLLDFMREQKDVPAVSPLRVDALRRLVADKVCLPEDAYEELFARYWEKWADYINAHLPAIWARDRRAIQAISAKVKRAEYGPVSVYYAHYKTAYSMKYHGLGIPAEVEKNYDGFFQFEDYTYECGYPIAQAIFAMMTIKQVHPALKVFPEIYETAIEGCNDGALVLAHPPYGAPVLPPFFTAKRIFEFCFGTMWFKDKGFHFWNDNGFHFRMPARERVQELVTAWGKVRKLRPSRPLRTTCFLFDLALIANHHDHYAKAPGRGWFEAYNTAEEDLAYAYTFARKNGLPAGFVTTCEDLPFLDAGNMDLLVIPPLHRDVPDSVRQTIRNLHRQGVNLLGFEAVCGLEDIFGVKPLPRSIPIRAIGFAPELAGCGDPNSLEYLPLHELCAANYENAGARPVVLGAEDAAGDLSVPVLSIHQTKWGQTAFFNIPPTVANREPPKKEKYGCECISPVIRAAFAYLLPKLSRPLIMSENGQLIAFHDLNSEKIVAILEEDSEGPDDGCPSSVLLKIGCANVKAGDISADKEYFVAAEEPDKLTLRFILEKHDSAIVHISNKTGATV